MTSRLRTLFVPVPSSVLLLYRTNDSVMTVNGTYMDRDLHLLHCRSREVENKAGNDAWARRKLATTSAQEAMASMTCTSSFVCSRRDLAVDERRQVSSRRFVLPSGAPEIATKRTALTPFREQGLELHLQS